MGSGNGRVIELKRSNRSAARRRVLCVDDDPAIGRLLVRWLDRQGYQAVPTSEPMEAVAQLVSGSQRFDALITDQSMPGMTGLELSRVAVLGRPDLVVFLTTALDDRLVPEELEQSGVSHLVAKPFDLPEMARALEEAFGRTHA